MPISIGITSAAVISTLPSRFRKNRRKNCIGVDLTHFRAAQPGSRSLVVANVLKNIVRQIHCKGLWKPLISLVNCTRESHLHAFMADDLLMMPSLSQRKRAPSGALSVSELMEVWIRNPYRHSSPLAGLSNLDSWACFMDFLEVHAATQARLRA
ncbi:hypothetical protein NKJ26_09465 [Mesorhizobium sp. M0152]|uniref:hypothetical protein n=1 Tax=Mesorhizobium sp. M0152 TaxID=2956898 RepID=UPI00333854A6